MELPSWKELMLTVLILAAATGIGEIFFRLGFTDANIITVYLFGVMLTSILTSGYTCSVVSSVASVVLFNYFMTEPRLSLHAYGSGYPVTFAIMLGTSILTSTLASKLKENAKLSARDAFRTKILFNTSQLLQKVEDASEIFDITATQLIKLLGRNLDEVAGTCVKNLQMNAQKRNVTLYYEGVSCMLRADRGMISELVENLCQNAIRYNNEGGEVHVRVYYEKGQPMLSVADNGIGIPKDQQERIFERFYRVDKSRSKQTGGTGLGLAIVKHIVELHDAVLHLESEPGKGTTITVAF